MVLMELESKCCSWLITASIEQLYMIDTVNKALNVRLSKAEET